MPRMKVDIDDLNIKKLEDAEYDDSEFQSYDGEIPPAGTILTGFVKKMWWTYTQEDGDDMLKILFVADGNQDTDVEEYEGAFALEYAPLREDTKFRWAPFLNNFGLTIRDVLKKTYVKGEDDDEQREIIRIGTWEPGSDEAYCRIVTARNRYQGEWRMKVGKWLPYEAEEDAEDEPEEEEPPARPSRAARNSKTQAGTRGSRRKAEPEPEDEDLEGEDLEDEEAEEEPEEEEAPKRPARSGRTSRAKASAAGRSKPAARSARGRGRGKSSDDGDEPPF